MFKEGLSIHNSSKMDLPIWMEFADSQMLLDERGGNKMHNCLVSIIQTGLSCTVESPGDQMEMGKQ